jgi:hypothetical protein
MSTKQFHPATADVSYYDMARGVWAPLNMPIGTPPMPRAYGTLIRTGPSVLTLMSGLAPVGPIGDVWTLDFGGNCPLYSPAGVQGTRSFQVRITCRLTLRRSHCYLTAG